MLLMTACAGESPSVVEETPPLTAKIRALHLKGQRLLEQGERQRAKDVFEESRQLAEGLDDMEGLARALNDLGSVASLDGRPAEAIVLHRDALTLANHLKHSGLQLDSLAHLGTAFQLAGQTDRARELYDQALSKARQMEDRHSEAVLLNNLGLLARQAGRMDEAEASFKSALSLNQGLGDQRAQAANLANLGLIAESAGRLDEAQARFEAALEMDKGAENREAIPADLASLARVAQRQNRKEVALTFAQRAYWGYRALGDLPRAMTELNRALALSRDQGRQREAAQLEAELKAIQNLSGPPATGPQN